MRKSQTFHLFGMDGSEPNITDTRRGGWLENWRTIKGYFSKKQTSVPIFLCFYEDHYSLTLYVDSVDTMLFRVLSNRALIFSKSVSPLQNLIWERHLRALLSTHSHHTSIHTFSPQRH